MRSFLPRLWLIALTTSFSSIFAAKPENPVAKPLIVYTYDTIAEKGGLGAHLKSVYETKNPGRRLELVSFTSAGEAVQQIFIEGKACRADILLGFDNSLAGKIMQSSAFAELPRPLRMLMPQNIRDESQGKVAIFDYGYLAFIYDSRRTKPPADILSLMEFATSDAFKKKVVIEDPRTSSIGSSFLSYTKQAVKAEEWVKFWMAFQNQLVRIAPSWSTAYGLFLDKSADYVLSYTTSPAYHREKEKVNDFKPVLFKEGQFLQWEGAVVLKSSPRQKEAFALLELLLSPGVQAEIPMKNWMYPVVKSAPLPASFADLPLPLKVVTAPPLGDIERTRLLQEWANILSR